MTDIPDLSNPTPNPIDSRHPIDPHRRCDNCAYFCPIPSPDGSGQCRMGPPETHVVLVHPAELPAGLARAGMAPQPQVIPVAVWPNVAPDAWCGAHEEI